ncbi:hypothetical protein N7472_003180 [Penicillium cf. griseofulvum]|uniref:Myb-like DNA-binding domain-containing protein n=1 Tax=Penicillium cf. griseofulvum TaxID=2972120 RepID=A0A9W9T294_9EURO|nr:hypothetical protein N7472_003180 [Penicillium cf. griseofulvum]
MASNEPTKAKVTKKAGSKPTPKTSRETLLEERLEFLLFSTYISILFQIDFPAVCQHYGISTNAAKKRLQRAKDGVAKRAEAKEAAQQGNEVSEAPEDEEA